MVLALPRLLGYNETSRNRPYPSGHPVIYRKDSILYAFNYDKEKKSTKTTI